MLVLSSLLLGALAAVGAAPTEDIVTNLPGYGELPFSMYSGFLSYTMSTGQQVRLEIGGLCATNELTNAKISATRYAPQTIYVSPL
jgi:hypothetical protein